MDYSKLSEAELKGKARGAYMTQMGVSSLGFVGGLVYANRTGGKFWRYVGYGILGSMVAGGISYFATAPRINSVVTELEKRGIDPNT